MRDVAATARRRRDWVGVAWPGGVRRPRRGTARITTSSGGAGPGPCARARRPHRHQPRRADAARPRDTPSSGRAGCRTSSRADELWCQLFSEPGAGSDLAGAVDTRASRRRSTAAGSLNGQKVWTSLRAVRRLGPVPRPHRPATKRRSTRASPRSSSTCARPASRCARCVQITGEAEFNEVFFDDVFVPDDQVVGAVNDGWRVVELDAHPRAGHQPAPARDPRAAARGAAAARASSRASTTTTGSQQRLARGVRRGAAVPAPQLAVAVAHSRTAASSGPKGRRYKLYWSEMSKRLHDTAMAVLGPAAPLWRGADGNPGDGRWQRVALLPGVVDLRRHQRDPAQHHRRTRARVADDRGEEAPARADSAETRAQHARAGELTGCVDLGTRIAAPFCAGLLGERAPRSSRSSSPAPATSCARSVRSSTTATRCSGRSRAAGARASRSTCARPRARTSSAASPRPPTWWSRTSGPARSSSGTSRPADLDRPTRHRAHLDVRPGRPATRRGPASTASASATAACCTSPAIPTARPCASA